MNKNIKKYSLSIVTIILIISCDKSAFLDKKPNSGIVIPHTLDDFTNLLDNNFAINLYPALPTLSADEYYYETRDEYNATIGQTEKNTYIWAADVFGGETKRHDWNDPYQSILYANTILDGLMQLSSGDRNSERGKNIEGSALFVRAFSYYGLAQTFCNSYDINTAKEDLGLPLKLSPNIDEIKKRSTLQETYTQILTDLTNSIPILPKQIAPVARNRPSKCAAYALLSRIYLNMRDYVNAKLFADSALIIKADLTDFNTLDSTSYAPFAINDPEIILFAQQIFNYEKTAISFCAQNRINTALFNLFKSDDLRKVIYFNAQVGQTTNSYTMKAGYAGGSTCYPFCGLATDEIYLIQSECLCRSNDISNSLKYLNSLLKTRYRTNTFVEYTETDPKLLLDIILEERRKELVWRGIRWADIKRLNQEGANITLTRNLDGVTYILPPNDPKYVMPIPQDEINLSHITQNNRGN